MAPADRSGSGAVPRRGLTLAFAALLALGGCGDGVRVDTAGPEGSETRLEPQQLAGALDSFSQRIEERVAAAADAIDLAAPRNEIRRNTLQWRIRTAETVRGSLAEPNAVVALVQLWYWCAAMDAYLGDGLGHALFADQQPTAAEAARLLHGEAEAIVRRMLRHDRFVELKRKIDSAAGRGELFTASDVAGRNVLSELLSVTKLETLLAIPLSPFNALRGIGRSGDALRDLAAVGDRGVELASRYPRLLAWYLQLMVLEIQGHDATRAALADFHSLAGTVRELGITAKELPERLRGEALALLEQSREAQGTAQQTLARAEATADALDRAAQSITRLTTTVDAFLATFRDPPGQVAKDDGTPARPFDIREYTTALQALESGARELRATVGTLSAATAKHELDSRMQALLGRTEASVERAKDDVAGLVDLAFWRALQLAVAIAALVVLVRFLRVRGTKPAVDGAAPRSALGH